MTLDEAIRMYETMAKRKGCPVLLLEWLKELRFRRQLDEVLEAYRQDKEVEHERSSQGHEDA